MLNYRRKIIPQEDLPAIVDSARKINYTIVTTNGCFDLFHYGHLNYLQEARSYGDILIVGVNSDASVSRLKGPRRPLIPQNERASILAGLSCVDYVFIFDEDTPAKWLEIIKPDFHVKGGDYAGKKETMPETPVMKRLGGMLLITKSDIMSSTETVRRILRIYDKEQEQEEVF